MPPLEPSTSSYPMLARRSANMPPLERFPPDPTLTGGGVPSPAGQSRPLSTTPSAVVSRALYAKTKLDTLEEADIRAHHAAAGVWQASHGVGCFAQAILCDMSKFAWVERYRPWATMQAVLAHHGRRATVVGASSSSGQGGLRVVFVQRRVPR